MRHLKRLERRFDVKHILAMSVGQSTISAIKLQFQGMSA